MNNVNVIRKDKGFFLVEALMAMSCIVFIMLGILLTYPLAVEKQNKIQQAKQVKMIESHTVAKIVEMSAANLKEQTLLKQKIEHVYKIDSWQY